MPEAKFIKKKIGIDYLCNICSENIDDDKIVGLKCNPDKHFFCYDCIFDWYKELNKKKKSYSQNYSILNMCPICRKKGGLLPPYNDNLPIKNINIMNYKKLIPKIICNTQLKNDKFCRYLGYKICDGLCKNHFKIKMLKTSDVVNVDKNIDIDINTDTNIDINTDTNIGIDIGKKIDKKNCLCGAKLKTKVGLCQTIGKEKYGGFCGKHKLAENVLVI